MIFQIAASIIAICMSNTATATAFAEDAAEQGHSLRGAMQQHQAWGASLQSPNPKTLSAQTLESMTDHGGVYSWDSEVFQPTTRKQLLDKVAWCRKNGVPLRVKGSGWSFNKFLDPTSKNGEPGVNILLKQGEFVGIHSYNESDNTVKVGAGTMRGPIYKELNRRGRQLMASGECFTLAESQTVGGLVGNAVHDTFQKAFTPETTKSLEVLVFDSSGSPVIRSFSDKDGDDYYAHFGGIGLAGIIVSATFYTEPTRFYHRLPYLPGSDYKDSFNPGDNALGINELVDTYNIMAQDVNADGSVKLLSVANPESPRNDDSTTYTTSFANALHDLAYKFNTDGNNTLAAFFFDMPDKAEDLNGQMMDGNLHVYGDSRYYKLAEGPIPDFTVNYTKFDDTSPFMGKEYLSPNPSLIDILWGSLAKVQDSIHDLEWKHANLKNFPDKPTENSLNNVHWAYFSEIPHLTGPDYMYTFEKAVEFYISESDLIRFAHILQHAAVEMRNRAEEEGAGGRLYADVRYAVKTDTAFMSSYYKENKLAVDLGVQKGQYSNELYTKMVTRVLAECKALEVPVRIHMGKFFVYDSNFTHWMYSENIRRRFTDVIERLDPYHVFAPEQWRELFTVRSQSMVGLDSQ